MKLTVRIRAALMIKEYIINCFVSKCTTYKHSQIVVSMKTVILTVNAILEFYFEYPWSLYKAMCCITLKLYIF